MTRGKPAPARESLPGKALMQGVFQFVQLKDVTGIAGTGVVATGYVAPNGKACMFWVVDGKPQTVVTADSVEHLCVHLHEGRAIIQWLWRDDAGMFGKCRECINDADEPLTP